MSSEEDLYPLHLRATIKVLLDNESRLTDGYEFYCGWDNDRPHPNETLAEIAELLLAAAKKAA